MKNKAFAVLAAIGCLLFASTAFADQPFPWQKGLQPPATSMMEEIRWFEQYTLWFIVPVTLFVLVLLIIVVVKFREGANPVPVSYTHLDVYKRQPDDSGLAHAASSSAK